MNMYVFELISFEVLSRYYNSLLNTLDGVKCHTRTFSFYGSYRNNFAIFLREMETCMLSIRPNNWTAWRCVG